MITILVIEDNKNIRENTCELLEMEGYTMLCASNGMSGLSLAKEKSPDIIICDILMPGVGGYEVLSNLKKNSSTSAIPFIFLTSSVEKDEIRTGLEMGANYYLSKPYEREELLDAIARSLSNWGGSPSS